MNAPSILSKTWLLSRLSLSSAEWRKYNGWLRCPHMYPFMYGNSTTTTTCPTSGNGPGSLIIMVITYSLHGVSCSWLWTCIPLSALPFVLMPVVSTHAVDRVLLPLWYRTTRPYIVLCTWRPWLCGSLAFVLALPTSACLPVACPSTICANASHVLSAQM